MCVFGVLFCMPYAFLYGQHRYLQNGPISFDILESTSYLPSISLSDIPIEKKTLSELGPDFKLNLNLVNRLKVYLPESINYGLLIRSFGCDILRDDLRGYSNLSLVGSSGMDLVFRMVPERRLIGGRDFSCVISTDLIFSNIQEKPSPYAGFHIGISVFRQRRMTLTQIQERVFQINSKDQWQPYYIVRPEYIPISIMDGISGLK